MIHHRATLDVPRELAQDVAHDMMPDDGREAVAAHIVDRLDGLRP